MTQGLNPDGKMQTLKVDAAGALMVSGIAGGGGGGSGTSNTTEATQLLVKDAVQNIDADLGAPADAAASSDAGTFSLIALVKRGLGNWTTLLGRIPALVGGRIPVDTSGAVQLGAGTVSATTQRVTLASDGPEVTNSTTLANRSNRLDCAAFAQADDQGAGTVYVQYRAASGTNAVSWYVAKYVTTSGLTTTTYAGPANNPAQASAAAAWISRAALVYGQPSEV